MTDFQALKNDEISVTKGDSVQILGLDQSNGYYYVRKLSIIMPNSTNLNTENNSTNSNNNSNDGWLPPHILQYQLVRDNNNSSQNVKKLWTFRLKKFANFHSSSKRNNIDNNHKDKDILMMNTSLNNDSASISSSSSATNSPNTNHRIIYGSAENVVDLMDELRPMFWKELENIKCTSGDTITFQCQVYINPNEPCMVKWQDAFGYVLRNGPRTNVMFDESTGICTLTIYETRLSDSGRFTCTATSITCGTCSITSAVLSVTGK